MRLIDADELLARLEATDRYFMVKYDVERSPTVNPWHYPSKGEYPKEDEEVLCKLLDGTYEVGKFYPSKYKKYQEHELPCDFGDYLEDHIECWQCIIPPKEEA